MRKFTERDVMEAYHRGLVDAFDAIADIAIGTKGSLALPELQGVGAADVCDVIAKIVRDRADKSRPLATVIAPKRPGKDVDRG